MAEVAVVTMILAALIPLYQAVTMVQEVGLGDMAVLNCPSNDESHRFQFWQLQTQNLMIGPTNKFNRDKYKYEVLTGTLYIRGVSSNEQGVYTCICKHISNNSFYAENVELVVKRDWEEVYETDHFTNVFRVVLMVTILLVLIALLLVLYNMRTDRQARFRALADEESPDEAGTVNGRQMSDLDSHGLDTELPRPTTFTDVRLGDATI
ncbi:uncharacterized protein LOC128985585 isoform X2 [Macrosteles quadrilineatus]|uniref:uncharacterized protein LOC128985585 isoform X2 n=1 Tax=Macrosteles quadrilineatus TaxID=74068 RepID=UPI0023E0D12F|nr:uncharacterized protein LOC128985585 isoform X2 [Macrosteles quadrilineatus]